MPSNEIERGDYLRDASTISGAAKNMSKLITAVAITSESVVLGVDSLLEREVVDNLQNIGLFSVLGAASIATFSALEKYYTRKSQ